MQPATRSSNEPTGQPLGGIRGDWRHRLLRYHLPLALVSIVVFVLWMTLAALPAADHQGSSQTVQQVSQDAVNPLIDTSGNPLRNRDVRQNRLFWGRATTATGYVALGLLGLTLLLGPANVLLRRRNPVSSYLRRDVGTWAAIFSVVHTIVGFTVHGRGASLVERVLSYFFAPNGIPLTNSFGLGNWTGLVATVIAVGLLAISSDAALRKLKAGPWKWLQRLNYVLFALVVLHSYYYGVLVQITSVSTIIFGLIVIAVFVAQIVGVRLWRQRYPRTTTSQLV